MTGIADIPSLDLQQLNGDWVSLGRDRSKGSRN